MPETVTTHSASETQHLAGQVAERVKSAPGKRATIVTLRGDLGAGKTTFTQGFLRALGIADTVTSPTFVLVQRYPLEVAHLKNAYHVDAYRLTSAEDLGALDLTGAAADPANVIVVEWPEVGGALFSPTVDVAFAHGSTPEERTITVTWHA